MDRLIFSSFIWVLSLYQLDFVNPDPIRGHNVRDAVNHEFPFAVAFVHKPAWPPFCTGALISKSHVLTAEHCLRTKIPDNILVAVGNVDLQFATLHGVNSWVTFDQWADETCSPKEFPANDIAVVKLKKPVTDDKIEPVKISSVPRSELHGMKAIIMGWGRTNANVVSRYMKTGSVFILTKEECATRVGKIVQRKQDGLHHRFFCSAADPYTMIGSGDSGGPLVDENNNLLGISKGTCPVSNTHSDTIDCAPYKITLHVSIEYYKQFINVFLDHQN